MLKSSQFSCSLVSSKNFSEILPPNGWRPGPGKVGQGGLKVLHLWRRSQKNRSPRQKIFFRVQSARLAGLFESTRLADPKKLLWTYEEFN